MIGIDLVSRAIHSYIPGTSAVVAATLIGLMFILTHIIYHIWLSPLSAYPGPKLWAATKIPYNWHTLRGTSTAKIRELHDRYGEVIRYEPNGLAYVSEGCWDEIYGPYTGTKPMDVDPETFGGGMSITGALQIPHAFNDDLQRLRSGFLRGMSTKAVASQEGILQKHASMFANRLNEELDDQPGVVDIAKWFDIALFDIIGDLVLGQSFGGLGKGEVHDWITAVSNALKALPILRVVREIPGVVVVGKAMVQLLPQTLKRRFLSHIHYSFELVEKRLKNPSERPDMVFYLTKEIDKGLTVDEIKENAGVLVMAGSEPTATSLTALCYFLAHNHAVQQELRQEICKAFQTSQDISLTKLAQLKYLQLVIQEDLRMFPPAPDIFPRVIPKGGKTMFGKHLPEGTRVGVPALAASYLSANLSRPEEFRPERWLDAPGLDHDRRQASQPFGQGHRSCIGKGLALAEIRLLLANVIWHFDLDVFPEDDRWLEDRRVYLGWDKRPLRLRLVPRTSLAA